MTAGPAMDLPATMAPAIPPERSTCNAVSDARRAMACRRGRGEA